MARDKTPNGIKKKKIDLIIKGLERLNTEQNGIVKRKPHRFRPGTVAQREINKEQKKTEPVIPRAPFQRLIKQIAYELPYHNSSKGFLKKSFTGIRFKKSSIEALRYAAEDYLIKIFKDGKRGSEHAKRTTLFVEDMRLFSENEKTKDFSVKEGKGQSLRTKNTNFGDIQYEKKHIVRKEKENEKIDNNNMTIDEQLIDGTDFSERIFI